jgi:hypothetical protein
MTQVDELRAIARKHSWAFEDLVVDAKMKDVNAMEAEGPRAAFRYLKEMTGSGHKVLRMALKIARKQGKSPVLAKEPKKQLMEIVKKYPWIFIQLLRHQKEREARELIEGGLQQEWKYLVAVYGGVDALAALRYLVLQQKGRRKSLWLTL